MELFRTEFEYCKEQTDIVTFSENKFVLNIEHRSVNFK